MLTAAAGSAFLYLAWWGWEPRWLDSLLALLFYWRLLGSDRRQWFWVGFFLGLLWFGWLGVSFIHYGHPWALPFVDLAVALVYGLLFWLLAYLAETLGLWIESVSQKFSTLNAQRSTLSFPSSFLSSLVPRNPKSKILDPLFKAAALLAMSYIHPFGFDWFKAELPLVPTWFGVDKAAFAALLAGILLARAAYRSLRRSRRKRSLILALLSGAALLLALDPDRVEVLPQDPRGEILLVSTRVPVETKWNPETLPSQVRTVFGAIDRAVDANASLVVLPESVLPFFLNREPQWVKTLEDRSRRIDILLGALYQDSEGENRNSAYLFHRGGYRVADKVVLVPFGEANPLPGWASKLLNRIFFDGAPDYRPASHPTDFSVGGIRYRIGVCYEGTSERLYGDRPGRLLLLSNNGWFYPSPEPTLQRILLGYYVRKYGTTIYNSVNMGPSYLLRLHRVSKPDSPKG